MANCGIPTFTCVLLLLFMAALYASASARSDLDSFKLDQAVGDLDDLLQERIQVRMARSVDLVDFSSRANLNIRGRQGRIADSGITEIGERGITTHGRRGGRRRRPRPNGGRRRGNGGRRNRNNGNLPAGVNRRMMRLANRLHDASSPFAARLFSAAIPTVDQNTVMSPYSVHTALSMTTLGARRRTRREMANVLGLRGARLRNMKAHEAYQGLRASLNHVHENVQLHTANAVFVRPNIPLEISFRQGLSQMYSAKFDSFNFEHSGGAEGAINEWVVNATRGKIQDLVPSGTITSLTTMVLINAIYFNATWQIPFNVRLTRPEDFHSLNEGVKSIDMMRRTGYFRYANHYNTEVVELPYRGERLAMYILLPNLDSSLDQLLQDFGNTDQYGANPVQHLFEGLNHTNLQLIMPKFRVESGLLQLKTALQSMGMERAFDSDRADFSGISATSEMYIAHVLHKAFIDVNEMGTEAAAATAVVIRERSGFRGIDRQELKVDRPFLFVIRDNLTKVLLFLGAYVGH